MATATKKSKADRDREAFLDLVERLVEQVEGWAKARKWGVAREKKILDESRLGTYTAPGLVVRTPRGIVYLEPVGRDIASADGRVDLLAWPSQARMMLVRIGGRWVPKTDSGVKWPHDWNRKTLEELIEALQTAG